MTWNMIKMSDALNHLLIPVTWTTTIPLVHVNGADALKKQIVHARLYDGGSVRTYWVTFYTINQHW